MITIYVYSPGISCPLCETASAKANTLSIKRIMLNIILPELFPKISTDPMIDLMT